MSTKKDFHVDLYNLGASGNGVLEFPFLRPWVS